MEKIFYLDTEFDGFHGPLISLALSPADSSDTPLYVVLDYEPAEPWVVKNVVPYLDRVLVPHAGSLERLSQASAARVVARYLHQRGACRIVADWPEDFSHFMDLFLTGPGMMVNIPDLTLEYRSLRGFNTADHSKVPHNALQDAIALRDYCEVQSRA